MTNELGSLDLPVPIVEDGEAAGDPLLDTLLAFCKAVVNEECATAWAQIYRGGGDLPIKSTFAFNPNEHGFSDNSFPALFAWREEDGEDRQLGSELHVSRNTIKLLWVSPSGSSDAQKRRDPFWHAVGSAIRFAITADSHPAWTHQDDDSDAGAFYGSSLTKWAQLFREPVAGKAKPEKLTVESDGHRKIMGGYCAMGMLVHVEESVDAAPGWPAVPFTGGVTGTVLEQEDADLQVGAFTLGVLTASVAPTTGVIAGGETVSIYGKGFTADSTVTFGTTAATVTYVDEFELSVVTPAHAVGLVDVTVTNLGDESSTLADAFTFT